MKRKQQDQKLFYRLFELSRAQVNEETRSVSVAFSSETPVNRYYGDEYLLHGKENVNFTRLKRMGAALLNHDPGRIIGSITGIRLDDDKIARAEIIFDDDDEGNRAFGKVKSGSLKGVSVGYRINKMREIGIKEEYIFDNGKKITGPAMLATQWEPYEISLTPIPADASVGVGRSLDDIEIERTQTTEDEQMNPEEIRKMIADSLKETLPQIITEVRAAVVEESRPKMRIDLETYQNLLGRAGAHSIELKAQVADMAIEGKTEREIVNAILDAATPKADAEDKGNGQGKDGTGTDKRNVDTGKVTFASMEDSDFFKGICNPGLMAIN
jgi:HK97 family phage prohead protease